MLELKNVSGGYGRKIVVSDVSAVFPKGNITSVIGANGCGKSTLLLMCAGLIPCASGEIYAKGGLNLEDPRIAVTPYFYDSNGVKIDDQNGTSASKNWKFGEDAISIYISKNEPNSVLFLKFSDARNISINRILTVYWNKVNK